jgi:hypothetical protein
MSFEISVDEKLGTKPRRISSTGAWSGPQKIAGLDRWPVTPGNHAFSIDLYGPQAALASGRSAGNLRVRFIRLPSGDVFSPFDIAIDPRFVDWNGGRMAMRVAVVGKMDEVAFEWKTHVSGLLVRDLVLIVSDLP